MNNYETEVLCMPFMGNVSILIVLKTIGEEA